MKKIIFTLLNLCCLNLVMAQAPEGTMSSIVSDMPNLIPPSPTVASLMKFEEIPVNNYTGIPDISIPLYSIGSLSKDIAINLGLKYHSASIQKDEMAGYTGLGWNLMAGGSISRTVRGLPDEIVNYGYGSAETRIGIYNDTVGTTFSNHARKFSELFGTQTNLLELPESQEFAWNAFEKGEFDNQHDLYQFNFMGHTGRFFVKKSPLGHLYVVKLYNDSSIHIQSDYTQGNGVYQFTGFTAYDDKGYKFVFDVKETTTETSATSNTPYLTNIADINSGEPMTYPSSFHLSKIYDNNNQLLVTINYADSQETITRHSIVNNQIHSGTEEFLISVSSELPPSYPYGLLPRISATVSTSSIVTKKPAAILVEKKARIYFELEQGRQDARMNNTAHKLKSLSIKTWDDVLVKKFAFDYDYTAFTDNYNTTRRLILKEVTEYNNSNAMPVKYKLNYRQQFVPSDVVNMDPWGYTSNTNKWKPFSREYDAVGVLDRMTLPTGGSVVFDFGSNTYSYKGETELTDFSGNPENSIHTTQSIGPVVNNLGTVDYSLGFNATLRYMTFETTIIPAAGEYAFVSIMKNNLGTLSQVQASEDGYMLEPGNEYLVRFSWTNIEEPGTLYATLHYRRDVANPVHYLYGGGARINRIGYFETEADPSYYLNLDLGSPSGETPLREKSYDYNFFGTTQSSGSLGFAEPVYSYGISQAMYWPVKGIVAHSIAYNVTTNFNNIITAKTHGSDVGYQNVTVSETGNGKSEYTYISPIDEPEENAGGYPFLPSKNEDFKRGLLATEKHYSGTGAANYKLLREVNRLYTIAAGEEITGVKSTRINQCPMASTFPNLSALQSCLAAPGCGWEMWNSCNPLAFLTYFPLRDYYGWAKLSSQTTKEYFYDDNNVQSFLQSLETFEYNNSNKKVNYHTLTNAAGENFHTMYLYHNENSPLSKNRISEIEQINSYKGSELLNSSKVIYSNTWPGNQSYLPQTIQIAKGTGTVEDRIKYNLYDEFSNPLEVQQESGIKICYIWGYHQSQPVAKIEGISYSAIPQTLITQIQAATNSANNETAILVKLEELRNHTVLAGAMVTTMTYKPLVGVSTMIDPKGDRMTYHYDTFGRLEFVRDKDGKLLSENQYHYRTQN